MLVDKSIQIVNGRESEITMKYLCLMTKRFVDFVIIFKVAYDYEYPNGVKLFFKRFLWIYVFLDMEPWYEVYSWSYTNWNSYKRICLWYTDFCFGLKPITIACLKGNYGDIMMFVSFMLNAIIL